MKPTVLGVFLFSFGIQYQLAAQPTNYGFAKQIAIDAGQVVGTAPMANFPVLISLVDPDLRTVANGGHVTNSSGYDITFVTTPCSPFSTLDHQIEHYDPTTGQLVAWVRIPQLSSTVDTFIYMFYGNGDVTTDPSTSSVWNSDYIAVYFLNNDYLDKTANAQHGTNSGTTHNASGKIGGGAAFGTGNYIQIPSAGISLSAFTVSMWLNSTSFSTAHRYLLGHTTTPSFNNRIQLYVDDTGGNLDLGLGGTHIAATNIFTFSTSQWYELTLSWNGSTFTIYVNGAQVASAGYTGLGAMETYLDIGNNGYSPTRNEAWDGTIDGVRLYDAVVSTDWIATEHNNQNDPSSFYSVTAEYTSAALCEALPIELKYFEASKADEWVQLEWVTLSEQNNDFFNIERSSDGIQWESIAVIDGAGNSSQPIHYSTLDKKPLPGTSYYQLKQTDFDGKFTYSQKTSVDLGLQTAGFSVFPNPVTGVLYIQTNQTHEVNVQLQDIAGRLVTDYSCVFEGNTTRCDVSGLKSGTYILTVETVAGSHSERIIVK